MTLKQVLPGHSSAEPNADFPVSLQQENRLLREQKSHPGLAKGFSYFLSKVIFLDSAVSVDTVRQATQVLVARHESIRTRFTSDGDGFWQHPVSPPPEVKVIEAHASCKADCLRLVQEQCRVPFPADTSLFLRVLLLRHDSGSSTVVLVTDHLVADDLALDQLAKEFTEVCQVLRSGGDVSADPASYPQFKDWALRQRRILAAREPQILEFWKKTIGETGPFPPSSLFHPLDGVDRARVSQVVRDLDTAAMDAATAISRRYSMSLFMVMLAALQLALMMASEDESTVVHSAISNRLTKADLAIVGWCAHGLPFKGSRTSHDTLDAYFRRSKSEIMDVLRHQELPLTRIVNSLAPASHGSARALRPARFYFGYYDHSANHNPAALINDEDVSEVGEWAQPGLSADLMLIPGRATMRLHFGVGRMNPEVVNGIADVLVTILRQTADHPDSELSDIAVHE